MAASAKYPTTEEMVRDLWDRQQISDVMLRFGRGLDLHDWDMYAATLTDPFEVDFFDLTGRAPATTTPKIWAHFASACLERLIVMHQYSNFHINLHGDVADGIFSTFRGTAFLTGTATTITRSMAGTRIPSAARRTAGRSASSNTASSGATAIPP